MMNVRKLVTAALLSAMAFVLMLIDFSVPLMPGFIKLDLSDLPALVGALTLGPIGGVAVEAVKNLLHLLVTKTGGIGELSNFLLGALFTLTAGLIYKGRRGRQSRPTLRRAASASALGAVTMAVLSLPVNYFVIYPLYSNLMPIDAILAAYKAILPSVGGLFSALLIFNVPFTLIKGLLSVFVVTLMHDKVLRRISL